jgi:hypothetical protein
LLARVAAQVLGGLIVYPYLLAESRREGLTADSFPLEVQRSVFEAMTRCHEADFVSGAFSATVAQLENGPAAAGADSVAEMVDLARNVLDDDIRAGWRRVLGSGERTGAAPKPSSAQSSRSPRVKSAANPRQGLAFAPVDPDACTEAVDGAAVLEEVIGVIGLHCVMSREARIAAAACTEELDQRDVCQQAIPKTSRARRASPRCVRLLVLCIISPLLAVQPSLCRLATW